MSTENAAATGWAARNEVNRHAEDGTLLSDDAAKRVAGWYATEDPPDAPFVAVFEGQAFDPASLYHRCAGLLVFVAAESAGSERARDLRAMQAWALARAPHVVLSHWKISDAAWEQRCAQWNDDAEAGGPDTWERPPADRTEVVLVSDVQVNDGTFTYPGDDDYPEDTTGKVVEPDGGIYEELPVVDAAVMMLAGTSTTFWAQSWGGDPFAPGDMWGLVDESERKQPFASRYAAPEGDVEIVTAEFVGLTAEQVTEVGKQWARV